MSERYHILHIEDDSYIRKVVQHTLGTDFDVVTLGNGLEAMTWLEKGNHIDVILTDLNMPHLDGQQLISLVRNSSVYGDVLTIVLSGSDESSLKIKCLDQGADDFMVKPFNPLVLKAKINAILRRTTNHRTFHPGFDPKRLSPLR